ncbi:hypothetical protein AaE_003732 [Aphanomyces astaci]|uniref:Uncharacterized protein n=1 Tax=Aphanomyces astaci TaxID=112090 RepID=A0A6A5A6J8_APHAT|nr:hypothetical protein AaE_003732 [Aphanomyces astaci]
MAGDAVPDWCREVCISSVTSTLCNRSVDTCPPCVRRMALGMLVCSPDNNCAASSSPCPPTFATTSAADLSETNRRTDATNPTTTFTPPGTTATTTTTIIPSPLPPDHHAAATHTNLNSSSILPMSTLVLVLAVAGSFLFCLAGCAWVYRWRRQAAKQEMDMSIVRHHTDQKHSKAYHPALANCKLDVYDMHTGACSYSRPRTTSRTQSMSKASWQDSHWSSTTDHPLRPDTSVGDTPLNASHNANGGGGMEPDPWLFSNPHRRSSVVELGGDSFPNYPPHERPLSYGHSYDSVADDNRFSHDDERLTVDEDKAWGRR